MFSQHDNIFSSSSSTPNPNNPSQTPPLILSAASPPQKTPSKVSKKDRHRKIYTAKGPRDRRMRLSLDVARKFFDLQDLLAFDKASTTVQWLLNKSKSAIKEHMAASNAKTCNEITSTRDLPPAPQKVSKTSTNNLRSRKSVKTKVARECRDKARARARERTLEKTKKMMMMIECGGREEGSKEKSSLEVLAVNTQEEIDGDGSVAVFDYNDAAENLFDQDPWERELMEYMNDRVFLGEIWDGSNTISV